MMDTFVTGLLLLLYFWITFKFDFCHSLNNQIVVATYNLWNVMYQWDIRKIYIANLMTKADVDIIGFLDVRANKDLSHTQLDELQMLLPAYKHTYFEPLKLIDKNHLKPGWEWEGIGYMSRHRILTKASLNLSVPYNSPDQTRKIILYSQFYIESEELEINIILLQLSNDKRTQCSNAYEIVKYVYGVGVESLVLMGDFHVFEEFNIPLKAIANGYFDGNELCKDIGEVFQQQQYLLHEYKFKDAWAEKFSRVHGFTYSNLPVPGLIGRPDRILVSKVGLKIKFAMILGKGAFYERNYGSRLYWNRYSEILRTAHEGKLRDDQNSTCLTDCGPEMSCRCGICITGGNQNTCKPGECRECSSSKLFLFQFIIIITMPCFTYNILVTLLAILGIWRPRFRRLLINKLRLRNYLKFTWFCLSTCVIIFVLIYAKIQFEDATRLVEMQPMDELQPSNHLMVTAKLELV